MNLVTPIDSDKYSISTINNNYDAVDAYIDHISLDGIFIINISEINSIEFNVDKVYDLYNDTNNNIENINGNIIYDKFDNNKKYTIKPNEVIRLLFHNDNKIYKVNRNMGNAKPEDVRGGYYFFSNYGRFLKSTAKNFNYIFSYQNYNSHNGINPGILPPKYNLVYIKDINLNLYGNCKIIYSYGDTYIYILNTVSSNTVNLVVFNTITNSIKFNNVISGYNLNYNYVIDPLGNVAFVCDNRRIFYYSLYNNSFYSYTASFNDPRKAIVYIKQGKLFILSTTNTEVRSYNISSNGLNSELNNHFTIDPRILNKNVLGCYNIVTSHNDKLHLLLDDDVLYTIDTSRYNVSTSISNISEILLPTQPIYYYNNYYITKYKLKNIYNILNDTSFNISNNGDRVSSFSIYPMNDIISLIIYVMNDRIYTKFIIKSDIPIVLHNYISKNYKLHDGDNFNKTFTSLSLINNNIYALTSDNKLIVFNLSIINEGLLE